MKKAGEIHESWMERTTAILEWVNSQENDRAHFVSTLILQRLLDSLRQGVATEIMTEVESQRQNTPADADELQRTYTRGRIAGLTWVLQLINHEVTEAK